MPAEHTQPTVATALRQTALPLNESRALLAGALACSREHLLARPEQQLTAAQWQQFQALVARRSAGEPLQYVLGLQEFYGRSFAVSPAVLIPRPETELLVEETLKLLQPQAHVLDLGTGSGCIAVSLALEAPHSTVYAVDASADALAVATLNAQRLAAQVHFLQSDWYAAFDGSTPAFNVIVSNPPYIAVGDPHLPALRYEPLQALSDGADGLQHLRQIAQGAPRLLAPRGALLVEHGYDQGAAVRQLFVTAGLCDVHTLRDLAGHERVCVGYAAR